MKTLAPLLLLLIFAQPAIAQVYSVEPIETGFSYLTAPTNTFVWESKEAKATLIFIPGGEGQIKLTPERKDVGGFYGNTLRPLSDPSKTSGLFNVVLFDSPVALPTKTLGSRSTADHMMRIESVVLYYKAKFNKPIWLMGHSNGAVSETEFYKYLQGKKKEGLISGMIYSSARNGATFNSNTNLPVLFLAHEQDGCALSPPSSSRRVYEDLKKTDKEKTEYVLIKGGSAEASEPCHSGYHMYYGAAEEAYKAIDSFAGPFYK